MRVMSRLAGRQHRHREWGEVLALADIELHRVAGAGLAGGDRYQARPVLQPELVSVGRHQVLADELVRVLGRQRHEVAHAVRWQIIAEAEAA